MAEDVEQNKHDSQISAAFCQKMLVNFLNNLAAQITLIFRFGQN